MVFCNLQLITKLLYDGIRPRLLPNTKAQEAFQLQSRALLYGAVILKSLPQYMKDSLYAQAYLAYKNVDPESFRISEEVQTIFRKFEEEDAAAQDNGGAAAAQNNDDNS